MDSEKELLRSKWDKILYTRMRIALGSHWQELTDEQNRALCKVLGEAFEIGFNFDQEIEKERADAKIKGRGFGSLT